MTGRVWQRRRTKNWYAGFYGPRYSKHLRHVMKPGHGMGMGANTLIHNGGKP